MWDIKFSKKPSQVNLPETDLHGLKKKHYLWSNSANDNIPTPELNMIRNAYDGFSGT
jgi:hypothetical protein